MSKRKAADALPQEKPKEKSAAVFRSRPSADVLARIGRALQQRLYLVDQRDHSSGTNGLCKEYVVLGSTGNVYNVNIGTIPSCNCPDCTRGHLCKHILFVFLRVLRVPSHSNLIYQKALLQSELEDIFNKASEAANTVKVKDEVAAAYKKAFSGDTAPDEEDEVQFVGVEEDCECPICFESIVFKGSREAVERCSTCRKAIHKECLLKWLARTPSCCFCRSDWSVQDVVKKELGKAASAGVSVSREGFINLGSIQGMSQVRDTSTYRRTGWNGYGYDDY